MLLELFYAKFRGMATVDPEVPPLTTTDGVGGLDTYIGNILNALIPILGITTFIMVIVGGFTLLSSSGNPENVKKGQQIVTFAVIGLILTIVAWLTLRAIETITGAPVTKFNLEFK